MTRFDAQTYSYFDLFNIKKNTPNKKCGNEKIPHNFPDRHLPGKKIGGKQDN